MDDKVKQNFNALLAYQKKDIELRKLNAQIDGDESVAIMNKYRRTFAEAKNALSDCDSQASAIVGAYDEVQKYINDNSALFDELEGAELPEAEKDLELRVRRLESLKSKFQSAEKKMHDIEVRAKDVCSRRSEALKTGSDARQRHNAARERHDKLVASKAADVKRLQGELASLRAGLDRELYADYCKLVEESKFPPVVPAIPHEKKGMYNCGGCGLNLSQQSNAALQNPGWCRCDNCHRIVVLLN